MLLKLMNNIELLELLAFSCGVVAFVTSFISVFVNCRKRMEYLSLNEEAAKSKMEVCKEVDSNVKIMLEEMGYERVSRRKIKKIANSVGVTNIQLNQILSGIVK